MSQLRGWDLVVIGLIGTIFGLVSAECVVAMLRL